MRAMYSVFLRPLCRSCGDPALATATVLLLVAGAFPLRASTLEEWLAQREDAPPAAAPASQDEDRSLTPFMAVAAVPRGVGQPTPLIVVVSPPLGRLGSRPDPETYVVLSNLPAHTRVSPGQDLGDGTWRLSLDDLAELSITIPAEHAGAATLSVTAVTDHGGGRVARHTREVEIPVLAPNEAAKAATVSSDLSVQAEALALRSVPPPDPKPSEVTPAVAPIPTPPPSPVAKPNAVPEQALMKRGDALFAQGDLAGARLFYEKAASAGSGAAALALGSTYDPLVHKRLQVRGLPADADQAATWYRRAVANGSGEAEGRLKELSAWIGGTAKQGGSP